MIYRRGLIGAALLWPLVFGASKLEAATITPTDLNTVDLGSLFAGPMSSHFTNFEGDDLGTLLDAVYFNSAAGLYTYTHTVKPSIDNISEFNTGFDVLGFSGIAGWSFRQARAAGGTGSASDFAIEQEDDGTIDWDTVTEESGTVFFDGGETITFFFQ